MTSLRARKTRRPFRLSLESLEPREVPTTRLILDFGGGIGMGNTFNTTVDAYQQIFGAANTGTNLTDDGLVAADPLTFTPLNYDFDLSGGVPDNNDITALANAVVPIIQRALEPFDIDVVVANTSGLADAVTLVGNNAGDATGEFDAFMYVMTVTSTGGGGGSVGINNTLFGEAAGADMGAQAGNDRDEASLTFADYVFSQTTGTQGTAQFNANLAQRMGYTATHEGFHTFTYRHTPDEVGGGASANAILLASGDVIRRGSNTRENPFIVTRFDLQHGIVVAEPNNYLLAAGDGDIGLRDANASGRPDLAYATGTGAHDQVILANSGGGVAGVTVNAFSDQARTASIATEAYSINLAADTDGTILVDASINNDEVRLDASIAATLRLRGGQGLDGIATENDLLTLNSGATAGTYTPGGTGAGTVLYVGGSTVNFSEFENVEADNVPVVVNPLTLSSASINENAFVALGASFVSIDTQDTHDVVIEWGDGSPNTSFTLGAGTRTFFRNHRYLDDNPTGTPADNYTIKVTVTDQDGDTGNRSAVVTVNNVAPTLSNLSATTIDENGVTTLKGRINDPGTQDTFSLAVNWGDPLSPDNVRVFAFPAGTTDFELTHQYLDDNPSGTPTDNYTIALVVTDDDTGSNPGSTPVTVNNVAPVITAHDNSAGLGTKAKEGEIVTVTGAFTDVGTLDTHTVSLDWNDGAVTAGTVVEAGGSGTFSGGHAYSSGGIFTVTVTTTDDDTEFDTAIETVFITGAGVQTINGKQVLFVVGTNGDDQVTVNALGNGRFKVHANFLPGGQRTFAQPIDEIRIFLCAGDDHATIAGGVRKPSLIDGGPGNDHLNGGGGGTVLLGRSGDDHLNGGGADDVLIGGDGVDRLVGNGGNDILIGGTAGYELGGDDAILANQAALMSILAEWNSSRSLAVRRANINGTGVGPRLNGANFLQFGVNVFDDGDEDKLTGSAGPDWYFQFPGDTLTGFHAGSDLLN